MRNMIDENGLIYVEDNAGLPNYIGTLTYGTTYSKYNDAISVAKLTFQVRGLADEYFFHRSKLIFQHNQSKNIVPVFTALLAQHFVENERHYPEAVIRYIIREYYVKELGYPNPFEATEEKTPDLASN